MWCKSDPIMRRLGRDFFQHLDAYVASGVGPASTFPVARNGQSWLRQPLLRIDYIFYDTAWQAQKTWVGAIDGSDHRYVMAELVLGQ